MNHLLRIVLVLSLPLIAIAALVISSNQANPLPSHEAAAGKYVAYRRSTTLPTLFIKQYTQARLPQNFRPDMSKTSFGNATYYGTNVRYAEKTDTGVTSVGAVTLAMTTVPTRTTSMGYGGSSKPIPFPPNDLWCARLSSPDPAAPTVILIALHQDIYNAEWIVHEVTDPEAVLAAVGCQFPSQ